MGFYKARVLPIEAFQVGSGEEPAWISEARERGVIRDEPTGPEGALAVRVLGGSEHIVRDGGWVCWDMKGYFFTKTEEEFSRKYEEVEPEPVT